MNYREKLYSTYVSAHTLYLYGEASIAYIKKQFPVWKRYYGRFLPEDKDAKILDIQISFSWFLIKEGEWRSSW